MPNSESIAMALGRRCPDCDSYALRVKDAFGIIHVHVVHDDTCPWLMAREALSPRGLL